MTLYIIRHGETEFNRLNIVQGSGVDTDLNETGWKQARAFFERYQDIDFQLVVTSKLRRTHQTVRYFLEKNLPWRQDADINEICWGSQEGRESTPESIAAYRRTIAEWKRGNLDAAMPGAESARELSVRLQRFIAWLRTRPAERMLVATHGRTMRALLTLLQNRPLSQMEEMLHSNTGCYIVHFRDGEFIFEKENCTEHLDSLQVA